MLGVGERVPVRRLNDAGLAAVASAITDPAGNRKLNKSATRFRIDGAVSTAMAIGAKAREPVDSEPSFQMLFIR